MRNSLLFLIMLVAISCSSTKNTYTINGVKDPGTVSSKYPLYSLADYLRKLSGVTVRESGGNVAVFVHIGNSFLNNSDPLFLIDGNVFNGNYSLLAATLNVSDIKSISVYKSPAEVGIYGVRGLNGVINIKLK